MTSKTFTTMDFNEDLQARVEDAKQAENAVTLALQPINELEEKKERLLDVLTMACLDMIIIQNQDTAHVRGEGQPAQLPSMADMRAKLKTLAENVAPEVETNGKKKADASRVSAIQNSASISLMACFLIGASFPEDNTLPEKYEDRKGADFRVGYYENIGNSKNVSMQYISPEKAFKENGELKENHFASVYWRPSTTFKNRIIDGQQERNTDDWKHATQAIIRKAYNRHFMGYALNADETDLATNSTPTEEPTEFCLTLEHLKKDYKRAILVMDTLGLWFKEDCLSVRYTAECKVKEGEDKTSPQPTLTSFYGLKKNMETALNTIKDMKAEEDALQKNETLKKLDKVKSKREELKKDGQNTKPLDTFIKNEEQKLKKTG